MAGDDMSPSRGTETTVYVDAGWDVDNEEHLEGIRRLTPGEELQWGQIRGVSDPADAEVHIALNRPTVDPGDRKLILYTMEPPCIPKPTGWEQYESWKQYHPASSPRPQRWLVDKTYDELAALDPIPKDRDLSWVTSDKGLDLNQGQRFVREALIAAGFRKYEAKYVDFLTYPTDGHILRMNFYSRLATEAPGLFDLYGRGDFEGEYYRGEIADKWDGLRDYRYSLAIENYKGPYYWSEKIGDALLAWCMPIYWGCTNLSDYLPEESFVRIDIESDDVVNRIREIVASDVRERNLDAIAEARERILNYHQLWPRWERDIIGAQ
jgi:hypothetical protein